MDMKITERPWGNERRRKQRPIPFADRRANNRVCVGLALGGGAARGWAHIGVLTALRQAGIDVDVVAGTSIGALAGGFWLARRLNDLDVFAHSINARRLDAMLDYDGAIGSTHGNDEVARLVVSRLGDIRFSDLARPFAAVTTEVGSGAEVHLTQGRLGDAVRASYALPGLMEPMQVGSRLLFDGALSNPLPVNACRALGADFVIAVDCNGASVRFTEQSAARAYDRLKRFALSPNRSMPRPGAKGALLAAFAIVQSAKTAEHARELPDFLIAPDLSAVGPYDFHRAREAITAGEETAMKMAARIRAAITEKEAMVRDAEGPALSQELPDDALASQAVAI
ncbi:NTE family protein RssA [Hartmannibacter diazotrophicus]|uniref:NTE family protein RssA n=1 Tax=Hartmannibacter diazotrophicus TaxID=1482074 RepID=A0A2C9D544_9HYPH|nr:patatin-like phospholipase family protein [Hartmannibacter diazotrophicus]SON55434.1 NTE family protein RssA [Hartmannibacter diazotrophicus]